MQLTQMRDSVSAIGSQKKCLSAIHLDTSVVVQAISSKLCLSERATQTGMKIHMRRKCRNDCRNLQRGRGATGALEKVRGSASPQRGSLNVVPWNPQESTTFLQRSFLNVALPFFACCSKLLIKIMSALQKSEGWDPPSTAKQGKKQ